MKATGCYELTMAHLSIADLLAEMPVDPEAHLDARCVDEYVRQGAGEPVVVYRTPEGLQLVDGYHRLAAARRRGEETIDADVRRGSRSDALRCAAELAAGQRGLGAHEAMELIRARGPATRLDDAGARPPADGLAAS
jgi:ParB-like chromosome segregation protein Spo0J